ncbi:MAG: histone deacetylase [Pseudomonadota bacterium]
MGNTAIFYDDLCTYHEMGYLHPESPRRLKAIKEMLDSDGVGREVVSLPARDATKEELAYIHDENYIKRIEGTDGGELSALDPDTSVNGWTWKASLRASGGFIACVDAVWSQKFKNAFAFVRPPGHHAERSRAMGFCIFNNIAIGAEWLVKNKGVERIAIVDFDVHHGNGTQHAFYKRPNVFFASVHHSPFYPGTGEADEKGEGEGRGTTLNVPVGAGADDDDYRRAIGDMILPAVERFGPQIILVSAGFDAHKLDPLGGMRMTTEGFRWIMRAILDVARDVCKGRVAVTLEGGYDLGALRESTEAQLEEMVIG